MSIRSISIGVLLFLVGFVCGNFFSSPAKAQNAGPDQAQWGLQPINKPAPFDAYLYNRQTGEAFMIESANKTALKLKR
ncbi:MAG TPA: hypothetical protein VFQ00_10570 [Terriglobales bacterium]|nr:hypothetical protein [Terriglobales bacterium]